MIGVTRSTLSLILDWTHRRDLYWIRTHRYRSGSGNGNGNGNGNEN
jgi:hypothetical protein